MGEGKTLLTLGPLAGRDGDAPLALGGPHQQAVLARLIVGHPHPVEVSGLADALWGDDPPPQWQPTLQAYVSRLRKILAPEFSIETGPSGYRLVDHRNGLDSATFATAVDRGERAAAIGRSGEVISILGPAMAQWRSDLALEPFDTAPWAASFSGGLERLRERAAELLADGYLRTGEHRAAATLLEPVVQAHPHRETATALLMLALYRSGRQAEALEAYRRCREALIEDIGVEPSTAVRECFDRVLRQDPSLDWVPVRTVPRILPPRPPMLVGRQSAISTAEEHLAQSGAVVLHGLPGVGKTSLAAELAHRHDGLVCWVPAEDSAPGLDALTELAAGLGVSALLGETELLPSLWRRLAQNPGWLLVFDNVEHGDRIRSWIPPERNGQIVVTSRNPAWAWLGPPMKVDPFDDEAAGEFVHTRLRRFGEDAAPLTRAMGGIALALEQACNYIDETQMSIERYLRIFTRRQRDLLARGAPAAHPHPVTTTWEIVLDDIAQRSPLAVDILQVCSFLSGDDLSLRLLEQATGGLDMLDLEDAVAELVRYSLIDRDGATFQLHRLVQELIRSRLEPDEFWRRAARAAAILASQAPSTVSALDQRTTWSTLTPHVIALLRAIPVGSPVPEGVLPLALDCVRHLRSRLALEPAHELLDLAIALAGERATAEQRAELHASRADVLDAEGHLAEARTELELARRVIPRRTGGRHDLTLARVWSMTGHILNCGDEPIEAIEHYLRALPTLTSAGHPDEVVIARIGIGYAYWSARDFSAAESEFRAALDRMKSDSWHDHPLHPEAISGLAMMLHEQGKVAAAIDLQRVALAETQALYGEVDHPALAYIHDKLGWELGLLGQHAEALPEHQAAADILHRLFGPDDPRAAMMISNRGLAEQRLGLIDTARLSQQRALQILMDEFGPQHRDTKLVLERLGSMPVELVEPQP